MNLLNIEVPIISAINGPAWRHSEIPLLCDIVLAADTVRFQDSAHFNSDVVPGDGMHIVYPLLLGMNRGRYFLMTGQTLDAAEALRLGLVAEVLPADKLLPRAWDLAGDLARRPTLLLRYTRLLFTEYLRRQMHDLLGYGLAMESLALFEKPEAPAAPGTSGKD
jgi:enoyl-CoA hydratase/carnithine racemase